MIKRIFNKESILVMLYMCFAAALVTSNVVAAKMFDLQFEAFGGSVMFNVGTFCYAITLLIANVISYLYGKQKSQIAIAGGFVAQILSTLLVVLLRYVPSTSQVSQDAYVTILGQNYIFVIGSLIAYVFCQLTNNYVFNKLLSKMNKKGTKGAWNFISNILGQLIDTVVFDIVVFGIGFGWLWSGMHVELLNMIIATWIFKCIIAFAYTGLFYTLTIKKVGTHSAT